MYDYILNRKNARNKEYFYVYINKILIPFFCHLIYIIQRVLESYTDLDSRRPRHRARFNIAASLYC